MISFKRIFRDDMTSEDYAFIASVIKKNIDARACCSCSHYRSFSFTLPGVTDGPTGDCNAGRDVLPYKYHVHALQKPCELFEVNPDEERIMQEYLDKAKGGV